jgi:hypothetical protein
VDLGAVAHVVEQRLREETKAARRAAAVAGARLQRHAGRLRWHVRLR